MVRRYTLRNEIPLFVVHNDASPVVSIQAWISRGSAHEPKTLAGISHFIEHALFKGTRKRKVGQIALEIESCGGEVNAFTSFDETVYYTTLASRYFDEGLDAICDAIQNPLFDKDEMAREREVILEEIKRAQDSPYKTVFVNLWTSGFPNTPYGRPVLGYNKTVSKFTSATLKRYFTQNYHAGTVALFIVGDIDPQKAFKLAEKKLAKIKRPPRKKTSETVLRLPKLGTPRVVTAKRDIQECHVQVGFRSPAINHPLIPALDLLCSAAGSGESSRLYQQLVKQKRIAMDADMGLITTNRCGMATLSLLTAPENLEPAIKSALEVLGEVAKTGLEDAELDRVKSSLEAEIVYGKETVEGYAKRLGYYYCHFGDPEFEKRYLDAILSITPEQTQNALKELLSSKPILSLVHPQNLSVEKGRLARLFSQQKVKSVTVEKKQNLPEKTERGFLRFITKRTTTLPITSVRLIFLGGSLREETDQNHGIGNLFRSVWTAGTKNLTSVQIARILESLGASINAFCGRNTCGLTIDFLSKHWSRIQPILSEILYEPTFPEDEFTTERDLILREILSQKDSPGYLCQLNFLKGLYGNHPYGRSHLGTQESISSLTTDQLRDWYGSYIHKANMVVSTVGHFQKDPWLNELEALLKPLPDSGTSPRPKEGISPPNELCIMTADKQPLFQSHIMLGFLGSSLLDRDRYILGVLSSCLAGQGGRLFLELRDRQSLAYAVAPLNADSPERGTFAFYIGCSPEKLERAISGLRTEIDKILDKPIPTKELDRAKQYLVGRFELDMQRSSTQAMLFGLDELYGLGYRHALGYSKIIRSITAKEIRETAEKYFLTDQAVISVVHPTPPDISLIQKAWNREAPKKERKRKSQSAARDATL